MNNIKHFEDFYKIAQPTQSRLMGETKVLTGLVRFSFPYVFSPRGEGDDAKYGITLLIPKQNISLPNLFIDNQATVQNIQTAIYNAYLAEQHGKLKNTNMTNEKLYFALHDGDIEKQDSEYGDQFAGCYYINASCKTKPGVVKPGIGEFLPITDTSELYAGCYGLATIKFYAYDNKGNKGIACGLDNIVKWADGTSLGGRANAEDDFKDLLSVLPSGQPNIQPNIPVAQPQAPQTPPDAWAPMNQSYNA